MTTASDTSRRRPVRHCLLHRQSCEVARVKTFVLRVVVILQSRCSRRVCVDELLSRHLRQSQRPLHRTLEECQRLDDEHLPWRTTRAVSALSASVFACGWFLRRSLALPCSLLDLFTKGTEATCSLSMSRAIRADRRMRDNLSKPWEVGHRTGQLHRDDERGGGRLGSCVWV
jgi:hypothetical protein